MMIQLLVSVATLQRACMPASHFALCLAVDRPAQLFRRFSLGTARRRAPPAPPQQRRSAEAGWWWLLLSATWPHTGFCVMQQVPH